MQQERRTTAVPSAAAERPRGAQRTQKRLRRIRTGKMSLIVEFELRNQPKDDSQRGSAHGLRVDAVLRKVVDPGDRERTYIIIEPRGGA